MEFTIHVKTIPHSEQRYPTVGDYWIDENGDFQLRVSETGDEYFNLLIAIHEMNELVAYYCPHDRRTWAVLQKVNDNHDLKFEANRKPGEDPYTEPGYDKNAPYFNEHMLGCMVEHYLAAMWNLDYNQYDKVTQALYEDRPAGETFAEQVAIENQTTNVKVGDR